MLPSFATQTITRERATLTDDGHGNMEPDWTSPAALPITGCSVQPGASQEDLINRDTTLIAYTVWAPLSADVLATDRIDIAGVKYAINGQPEKWATGILDHTKLLLESWAG